MNTQEVFDYLFELQASGVTNMFGAGPFVSEQFNIGIVEARDLVAYWMKHYEELKNAAQKTVEIDADKVSGLLDTANEDIKILLDRVAFLEGLLKMILERQSVYSQDTFSPFSMGYDAGTKAVVDIARLAFEE